MKRDLSRAVIRLVALIGTAALTIVVSPSAPTQARAVERALHTSMTSGTAGVASGPARQVKTGRRHFTNAQCNTGKVRRNHARCFAVVYTAIDGEIQADASPPAGALGPPDIQSAYNLPSTGQGETVALVDAFGDSHAEDDLAAFRSFYGLAPCTTVNGCFQKVDQSGGTNYPADDSGWGLETSLDLDAVSAACPNCHILLVEANDNLTANLGAAVNEAVALGAKFVSNSYGSNYNSTPGSGEDPSELDFDTAYYQHPGVAVTVSSGDLEYGVAYPAASQYVTSVGGTLLTKDTSAVRGWRETVWDHNGSGAGSGCSVYEPQPANQQGLATQCANRAVADISADADPTSGLATYDTLGTTGWLKIGGTSLASPLVAAMYALAGTPAADTYPASYPYDPAKAGDLNDVTQGINGSCGNVLCNAGPGWDGPTGLGTPNGVGALSTGPHGDIAGRVIDTSTNAPLAGATVAAGPYVGRTDSSGHYDLNIPVGSYDLTARAWGFAPATQTGVQVREGQTTRADFALTGVPNSTLSGTITDGSGHGWPLYAKITIDGDPNGPIYTDPYTGNYSIAIPQQNTYTLHVSSMYPGYTPKDLPISIGTADKVQNAAVAIDASCTAPGYVAKSTDTSEQFTGWTGTTPQDGWTNLDFSGNGQVWEFDNPGGRTPPLGGDTDFAIVDSDNYGAGNTQITSLVSPVVNLATKPSPAIGFDTTYKASGNQEALVELSLDGGQTWTTVWQQFGNLTGHVNIPIPQAAGQSAVQVRFDFFGRWGWWWGIDNVSIGNSACVAAPGGLVDGVVTDGATRAQINGARVASATNPGQFALSAKTPDDKNVPDGFYWLFASPAGKTKFTATALNYKQASATVNVLSDNVTHKDWTLKK
jgi:hypothetical protein